MRKKDKTQVKANRRRAGGATVAVMGLVALSGGCSARTLTIVQEDRINTAMHQDRPQNKQTGNPLEVSIVCVFPSDLEKPENARLQADEGITAKEWYEFRPTGAPPDGRHFNLPCNQIYMLTNEESPCGKVKGPALRGALEDGYSEKKMKGILFKKKLHSRKSVIYVFPKFIDKNGEVLPVLPVKYHPPGGYTAKLVVKIGVQASGPHGGQYIENQAKRRLHGREKKE